MSVITLENIETADLSHLKHYKLMKPVTVAGNQITEVHIDIDNVTQADKKKFMKIPEVRQEMIDGSPETSETFVMNLLAKASGLRIEEIDHFSIVDTTALRLATIYFFKSQLSQTLNQRESC